jgi:hypothetical protein
MKKVLIESPYMPPSSAERCTGNGCFFNAEEPPSGLACRRCGKVYSELRRNIRYLRAALHDSLLRGEASFASHAIYTQLGVLNDDDTEQRRLGITAGLTWGAFAELTAVYDDLGVSPGMEAGIEHARANNRPVVFRQIPGWLK